MKTLLILISLNILILCQSKDFKIDSNFLQSLVQDPEKSVNVFISFENGETEPILAKLSKLFTTRTTRAERNQAVYTALNQHAEESQRTTLEFLSIYPKSSNVQIKSYWISNQIYIKNAQLELILGLMRVKDVKEITQEVKIHLDNPILEAGDSKNEVLNEWGVERIRAHEVWEMPGGNRGEGIIIGSIDTGVRYTHEALRDNYIGAENNGWFDPYTFANTSFDDHSHGTHVTGTFSGKYGIGVAPNSKWRACKAFKSDGEGDQFASLDCGQFYVCPHNPDGNNPDCSLVTHIVSNSWGDPPAGLNYFNPVIFAWQAIGIIPVFSAGNNGNNCQTTGYPGRHPDVLGIGAIDITNSLASFSSVGPNAEDPENHIQKPEFSGPGVNVRSSTHMCDACYAAYSGTSMSCPHASGLIGLMLSYNENLTYDQIKSILQETATSEGLNTSERICENIPDSQFPNYHFGHGVMDSVRAFNALFNGTKF